MKAIGNIFAKTVPGIESFFTGLLEETESQIESGEWNQELLRELLETRRKCLQALNRE